MLMPSLGSRDFLEAANRADEFYLLLADDDSAAVERVRTLRRVLAADPVSLAGMVRTNERGIYDDLRNLEVFAAALSRLTEVALERFAEAVTRNSDVIVSCSDRGAGPN